MLHALLASAVLAAAPARAAPKGPPPEVHQLPNGVRVVLIPFDSPGLVAYYTLMRVGSRNEPEPGRSGYAHFFEHMMFRGTPTNPGDKYGATVAELGLDTNAFTTEDMTVYYLFGPSKALPTIIDLEADRFQHLAYSEGQFKTEAGAILGEYAKGASNPVQMMEEKVLETAYTDHTYRHTVIGYLADVKAMPSGFDYSREFFRRYYTPDNATVFVVGDFDRTETLAHLTQAYGPWTGKAHPAPIHAELPQHAARRAAVPWGTPTLPRVWMNWHTPSAANLRATAVQLVLNEYLFGETSPLVQDLVRTRQLADAVQATYGPPAGPLALRRPAADEGGPGPPLGRAGGAAGNRPPGQARCRRRAGGRRAVEREVPKVDVPGPGQPGGGGGGADDRPHRGRPLPGEAARHPLDGDARRAVGVRAPLPGPVQLDDGDAANRFGGHLGR